MLLANIAKAENRNVLMLSPDFKYSTLLRELNTGLTNEGTLQLSQCHKIMIPYNKGAHWVLIELDLTTKRKKIILRVWDSLKSGNFSIHLREPLTKLCYSILVLYNASCEDPGEY